MKPFSIAGIQMRVSASYSNVEAMKLKLNILMNLYPWVDMVVYSELCAYGPLTHHSLARIEDFEEPMQELARKHKVWLLPGSVFHTVEGKIYNTASVIDPDGNVVTRYRKMFPFYPYEVGVTPGHEFCLFDVPEVGRFGVSICYDMWFPETTRTLAVQGAEVILHPTLTGTIDREIELSIVRASAAINQCYIFDINGLDTGGSGRSIICGPEGRVMYQAQNNEEMIPIEINLEKVRRSRELGLLRLGQPLKSFRDHLGDFDIYWKNAPKPYLDSLGPLIKPQRVKELGDLRIQEEAVGIPGKSAFTSSIPPGGSGSAI
ncbi:MAG: carbon-nitrogen hydrolase family protein [Flavobacteriales bacterium]|jgi:predicted amidohydrolase|nr:carbon-nitrogen hydrolase family protein [Flavobacteriales bacterium]MBK6891986.1 carbon-nitrogen hydrolase family protein [Flavobacteriales bacterium]MBK9060107.1 carbon-nitrogen hydrolase family protein [Flavobacteriales bacterium]MBK9598759.1 carbon-nitrogen hydrolase family protein [Flavobacteriales bacterium]QQS71828.1 MAG: carbon-nitrogen hydrolase family protein [Flavobacteriales bacterium]